MYVHHLLQHSRWVAGKLILLNFHTSEEFVGYLPTLPDSDSQEHPEYVRLHCSIVQHICPSMFYWIKIWWTRGPKETNDLRILIEPFTKNMTYAQGNCSVQQVQVVDEVKSVLGQEGRYTPKWIKFNFI